MPAKRKVASGRPCCGHQCLQIGMGDTPVDFSLDLGGHEFLAFPSRSRICGRVRKTVQRASGPLPCFELIS